MFHLYLLLGVAPIDKEDDGKTKEGVPSYVDTPYYHLLF